MGLDLRSIPTELPGKIQMFLCSENQFDSFEKSASRSVHFPTSLIDPPPLKLPAESRKSQAKTQHSPLFAALLLNLKQPDIEDVHPDPIEFEHSPLSSPFLDCFRSKQ
ncbi:unnamed protein product [Cuscuta epithymum]|uniref:Uncharacterized protein n=1 Tax=Cuscuta epithymum TaxID=186058 RepID=A0AAV0D880_9ASTE|nr:unnamed protein product [Cuscuta epithymum]